MSTVPGAAVCESMVTNHRRGVWLRAQTSTGVQRHGRAATVQDFAVVHGGQEPMRRCRNRLAVASSRDRCWVLHPNVHALCNNAKAHQDRLTRTLCIRIWFGGVNSNGRPSSIVHARNEFQPFKTHRRRTYTFTVAPGLLSVVSVNATPAGALARAPSTRFDLTYTRSPGGALY